MQSIDLKKLTIATLLAIAATSAAHADTYVNGYTRRDGTYVQGYNRTEPNYTRNDNYSTRGNYNPYTGQEGHKPRDEDYGYRGNGYSRYGY
ncbi:MULTISPECIES: hypothetical protein [unclassified Paraburkholderia]|uniref:hypothetical protein n=1 Tax=unclassified Paraburkholderia TaxID=2615204 RepID=UPI0016079EF1|nr:MULTISPECIES: hypothetical protein [unclassified Paraburkholderia]MBB5443654.1 hypothetical protein [Paraburkholderia sp. WSM4177]MBB5484125.1 hypothetical protein [Paraburkholderia sp. WSM4180]